MPTLSTHLDDRTAAITEEAARISGQKVGPYIADALRAKLHAEGHLPGTPAHDIRAEALAAAELVGADRVLAALRDLRADAYSATTPDAAPAAGGGA